MMHKQYYKSARFTRSYTFESIVKEFIFPFFSSSLTASICLEILYCPFFSHETWQYQKKEGEQGTSGNVAFVCM